MPDLAPTLIYFSPTRTTTTILRGVAEGLSATAAEELSLTMPGTQETRLDGDAASSVAVIGVPVYGGRVPEIAVRRLRRVTADGMPAVLVAVYGNRAFEDALIELYDITVECGFKPFAAAAFIGEHSFSTEETPIASGRPDGPDMALAVDFGKRAGAKLAQIRKADAWPNLVVPGDRPYKDGMNRPPLAPEVDIERCTICGACAEVCPTGAITPGRETSTDANLCVTCFACVRQCPEQARSFTHPGILEATQRLATNCSERKEPEIFL